MNTSDRPIRLFAGSRLTTDGGHPVVVGPWRGEGSYARVYQGTYGTAATPCALKLAKAEVCGSAVRLQSEQRVLAALHHPHLVDLLDSGTYVDLPYLVLAWLEGETLLDLLTACHRLSLRQSLQVLENICDALAHIHERGLVHGDLRPQNVVIVPDRGAVLTDPSTLPDAAERLGCTPGVWPGSSSEDVHAAGALFHRMLTGLEPCEGSSYLTAAAGYNKAAMQLWESTRRAEPPPAADLLLQVRRLRRTL